MKTTLLAILALAVSASALCAESALPLQLGAAPTLTTVTAPAYSPRISLPLSLTLAQESDVPTVDLKLEPGSSNFAQLDTNSPSMPLSSGFVLALVAGLVLALRVMKLNHARAMADHERDSYHGKARMFHALREGARNS
jgi:hypothetical protein